MNARQFLAWARPHLAGPATPARELFLALPSRWARALGPARAAHFLESSASSAGFQSVKLALILRDSPEALARRHWRDEPGKTRAGARLLRELDASGARYDEEAYARACGLLERWRLRGSLMISCDLDRAAHAFGKLTFYGFAPEGEAVSELIAALGGAAPRAGVASEGRLEFWGLDLWPTGKAALKLYRRRPYRRDEVPAAHRTLAAALETVGAVRDLTTLTRVARGRAAGGKLYLGLPDGVEADKLGRLPAEPATARFLAELARRAAGQRVYFLGVAEDGTLEAYFDRRTPDHEEQGPIAEEV